MDDYAQGVREVCAEQGLECLDLASQIKPMGRLAWEQHLGDRAHPNAQGHEWLATKMADWVLRQVAEL
jgi:lysophospholipase L1-like esterase